MDGEWKWMDNKNGSRDRMDGGKNGQRVEMVVRWGQMEVGNRWNMDAWGMRMDGGWEQIESET